MIDLNDWPAIGNFSRREVACKCDKCNHISNMMADFMDKLQKARDWLDMPMYVTSGCRCKHNNRIVGGKINSSHLCSRTKKACACDVKLTPENRPMTSGERFLLVTALLEAGFRRIGIYDTFIHCDSDIEKPQKVMW